jgi:DNA primase
VIAQETIDRIREQTSLAELIGEAVKLERRGRSFVGLCPFHQERTPSFHVNDERGFYHCFGCKAAGDAFKFVQETEGLEFIEAVRRLAERLGIEIVDDLSDTERRQRAALKRREQTLYDVMGAAASFFEKMLIEHPQRGYALGELERRGLSYGGPAQETLRSFRIGYAPESWDALASYLRKAGLDLESAEKVGLVAPRKQGAGYYDRFRHRLMFAVIDLQGRVVAFSGRALEPVAGAEPQGDAPAKYINSPETPIYKKRETVFGLYQARGALRADQPCVVVEGNFDVVSLHARGVPGAVAPLGTAFTVEQGKLIKRFATSVTFLFDADKAGRKAVIASRQPCREAGLSARVASLPDGMDPDEFSKKRGAEGMQAVLRAARGMLEHLMEEVLDEAFTQGDARSRAEKLKQVTELLASEDDPAVRALAERHADYLASRLNVADARTFRALQSAVQRSFAQDGSEHGRDGNQARNAGGESRAAQAREPMMAAPQRARSRARLDEIAAEIIGAILDFPELLDTPEVLAYGSEVEGDLASALAALRQCVRNQRPARTEGLDNGPGSASVDFRAALAKMPPSIRPFAIARMAAPRHQRSEAAHAELVGNVKKLRQHELSRLARDAMSDLERARRTGDMGQEDDLLREIELRARKRRGL